MKILFLHKAARWRKRAGGEEVEKNKKKKQGEEADKAVKRMNNGAIMMGHWQGDNELLPHFFPFFGTNYFGSHFVGDDNRNWQKEKKRFFDESNQSPRSTISI